jgi:hypothetical protein
MATTILTYDPNKLPAGSLGIPNHPSSDEYVEGLRNIQREIVGQSVKMHRLSVLAVKQHHRGQSAGDIATEMGKSFSWVKKQIKSDDGQRLIALLAYYQEAIDGPNEAQRRAMLWRISMKFEVLAPKVTISAIAELNKMHGIEQIAKASVTSGDINIVINNQLSRTALDE